jgi:hypothetical protein
VIYLSPDTNLDPIHCLQPEFWCEQMELYQRPLVLGSGDLILGPVQGPRKSFREVPLLEGKSSSDMLSPVYINICWILEDISLHCYSFQIFILHFIISLSCMQYTVWE